MTKDPVRAYLAGRGCSAELTKGGLHGLASRWEHVVDEVEEGYALGLDDYLNDMDLRDILEGALGVASGADLGTMRARVDRADERLRALTRESKPLWGEDIAREHGHDPVHTWWYFRRPKRPGRVLSRDLSSNGL